MAQGNCPILPRILNVPCLRSLIALIIASNQITLKDCLTKARKKIENMLSSFMVYSSWDLVKHTSLNTCIQVRHLLKNNQIASCDSSEEKLFSYDVNKFQRQQKPVKDSSEEKHIFIQC